MILGQPCPLPMKLRGDLGSFETSKMDFFPKISTIDAWQSPKYTSEAIQNINSISIAKKSQVKELEKKDYVSQVASKHVT